MKMMSKATRLHSPQVVRLTQAGLALLLWLPAIAQEVPRAVPVPAPVAAPAAKSPDEDLFDYATLCYTQKDFQIATKPYLDYTRLYPQGRHSSEAWFRLGECFLKTGHDEDARRAYSEVLTRFPKSESAASAGYRLGAFAYNAREFSRAASYFDTCARLSTEPAVKLAATYNTALAYKQAGERKKSLSAYKAVASAKGENAYREAALSEVAAAALETGQKDEALSAFNDIIAETKDDVLLGDALIKSGLILNEIGKSDLALKNFKRAIGIISLPRETRGIAVFGLIQGYYAKADYVSVVETYVANATTLPSEDLRPKMLLLVGNAQKQKQSYRQAIDLYLMIERQFPDSMEAFEAGYQKLLCFYQLNDKDIPQFTKGFEERYADRYKNHEFLLMARLIRADWFFGKAEYTQAADAFTGIDPRKVPEKVRASVLYKKGFAEAEAGKYNDAIGSLSEFIADAPTDANIPIALAQRGVCQKAVRAFDKALADFTTIIKDHSTNNAAEMAYYQSGLIKAETRNIAGMIADFEALVSKFPNSAAASDAYFQIGRGYFDLKTKDSYAKALPPLRKAIGLDSTKWLDKASQLLISSQYLREDVDGLAKEVDAYRDARKDATISPTVLTFLGFRYYERNNFRSSAFYFNRAATPDNPDETEPDVWNYLGLAELENGNHENSIRAFDNYLAKTPEGAGRARALLGKGRALLALGKFDEASQCAADSLLVVKEGKIHALLQLLQGDIALAHGDALAAANEKDSAITEWKKSAGNYVVVSQIFVDPQITPEALDKSARVLDKLGEKDKADNLRKQLAGKYPNYKMK
ncbi:MAG: tetratricopeptide repeat protein [Verrucomicrobiaceae bacterium]